MKCPICDGDLQYIESVDGEYVHDIDDDGTVYEECDYYGESSCIVRCRDCGEEFGFDYDDEDRIILEY